MRRRIMVKIKISGLRKRRHMTQKELARKAQLSKTTVSNLESGSQVKIELSTIGKLCDALQCTPNELFEFYEEDSLVKEQKKALRQFIGKLDYEISFDHKKLDKDLAQLIDEE
jgi:DNA-binding Xre family transcriptional regulator